MPRDSLINDYDDEEQAVARYLERIRGFMPRYTYSYDAMDADSAPFIVQSPIASGNYVSMTTTTAPAPEETPYMFQLVGRGIVGSGATLRFDVDGPITGPEHTVRKFLEAAIAQGCNTYTVARTFRIEVWARDEFGDQHRATELEPDAWDIVEGRQEALRNGTFVYTRNRQYEISVALYDVNDEFIVDGLTIGCALGSGDYPELQMVAGEFILGLYDRFRNNHDLLRRVYRAEYGTCHVTHSPGLTFDLDAGQIRSVFTSPTIRALMESLLGSDLEPSSEEPEDMTPIAIPALSSRQFGIEMEFAPNGVTQDEYANALVRALQNVPGASRVVSTGYDHSNGTFWHLKTDSSCGLELASPILTMDRWPEVEVVLRTLRETGARITAQCGFHVHHNVSEFQSVHIRRLLLLWAAFEKTAFAMVKTDRASNRFCMALVGDQFSTFEDLRDNLVPAEMIQHTVNQLGRYRSLNCTNWWRNGTVEVRSHHGTLLTEAIKFWVLTTQQIVELALVERDYSELEEIFAETVGSQLKILKGKMEKHKGKTDLSAALDAVIKRRNPKFLEV